MGHASKTPRGGVRVDRRVPSSSAGLARTHLVERVGTSCSTPRPRRRPRQAVPRYCLLAAQREAGTGGGDDKRTAGPGRGPQASEPQQRLGGRSEDACPDSPELELAQCRIHGGPLRHPMRPRRAGRERARASPQAWGGWHCERRRGQPLAASRCSRQGAPGAKHAGGGGGSGHVAATSALRAASAEAMASLTLSQVAHRPVASAVSQRRAPSAAAAAPAPAWSAKRAAAFSGSSSPRAALLSGAAPCLGRSRRVRGAVASAAVGAASTSGYVERDSSPGAVTLFVLVPQRSPAAGGSVPGGPVRCVRSPGARAHTQSGVPSRCGGPVLGRQLTRYSSPCGRPAAPSRGQPCSRSSRSWRRPSTSPSGAFRPAGAPGGAPALGAPFPVGRSSQCAPPRAGTC